MASLLFQAFASANVKDSDSKKQRRRYDENNVQHGSFFSTSALPSAACAPQFAAAQASIKSRSAIPVQNFTRIAMFRRFSTFRRSGVNPGTKDPGDPQMLFPITGVGHSEAGGVTPPGPEKYGTLAPR